MAGRRAMPDGGRAALPGLKTPGPDVPPDKRCDDATVYTLSGRPLQKTRAWSRESRDDQPY